MLPRSGGRFSIDGREYLNFSCNDYLDLAGDQRVLRGAAEALRRFGAGAGASRLVTGTLACHAALEEALAAVLARPAALVFGFGCLANLGFVSSVVGRGDLVFADRLVHATLIDGSSEPARLVRFLHNDVYQLDGLMSRGVGSQAGLALPRRHRVGLQHGWRSGSAPRSLRGGPTSRSHDPG